MFPSVSIILGSCGDKMLRQSFKQGQNECCHLVPFILEEGGRVCTNISIRLLTHRLFSATCRELNEPTKVEINKSLSQQNWNTCFQTTRFFHPPTFLVLKINGLKGDFDLCGVYEILPRRCNSKDSLKLFGAKFKLCGDQWQITEVKNSGID